ncbi:thioredoxin [Streptomyces qinzhouensis]|uniref:Thioredoxin n=1 Tax=Streptomyces qinzhouensis TaxID=2599401 RepID=A0A5B8JFN0_9ACTN|nr:thioredoxin [Streptomyces qinzhouensis]QDY79094.1 thioredoxin [Streptomyces qinzhouensis]
MSEVTDADFDAVVLGADRPVLVKFTADWCPPCRQIAPVLAEIAREEADRLTVVRLDVDRNPLTTRRYGVLSMPTLMVFRDGEPVHTSVGARAKRRLLAEMAGVLDR